MNESTLSEAKWFLKTLTVFWLIGSLCSVHCPYCLCHLLCPSNWSSTLPLDLNLIWISLNLWSPIYKALMFKRKTPIDSPTRASDGLLTGPLGPVPRGPWLPGAWEGPGLKGCTIQFGILKTQQQWKWMFIYAEIYGSQEALYLDTRPLRQGLL